MKKIISFLSVNLIVLCSYSVSFSQSSKVENFDPPLKTEIVKVRGVGCSGELTTIANKVLSLKGVIECKVIKGGSISKFEVTYNTSQLNIVFVNNVIENINDCENPNGKPYTIKK